MHRDDRIALLLVALLVAGGLVLGFVTVQSALRQRTQGTTIPRALPTDPAQGEAAAPVTLIEYGDFACPFCKEAQPAVDAFLARHPQTVRLVWKDFPLSMEHAEARGAAEAARCAQEQGKFWEMHDALFANQNSLGSSLYPVIASQLGLDTNQFQSCMDTHRTAPLIADSVAGGNKAGVDGTPYFFLDTIAIPRVPTLDELEQALQRLQL